jgi:hypothetical protein
MFASPKSHYPTGGSRLGRERRFQGTCLDVGALRLMPARRCAYGRRAGGTSAVDPGQGLMSPPAIIVANDMRSLDYFSNPKGSQVSRRLLLLSTSRLLGRALDRQKLSCRRTMSVFVLVTCSTIPSYGLTARKTAVCGVGSQGVPRRSSRIATKGDADRDPPMDPPNRCIRPNLAT